MVRRGIVSYTTCSSVTVLEILFPLLLVRISTAEQSEFLHTVFGIVGNNVSLPCNISPPTEDDAVALILWYKDEATTPSYSLDARRGSLNQARHAASDILSNRAYLSIAGRPSTLHLGPLKEEDEGFYRCRVDFRKARTRNSDVILTVLVPPKTPIITDHSGEILQSLIGPYNEGDRLVLICEAEGGKPLPMVTWWRESVLLDDTYDMNPIGIVRNELELSSLQRHDLMAVYTCQASNNNFSNPAATSVTVDMNFRPVEVEIMGENNPLSAGKSTEFVCRVTGSRPPAAVSWWLEKRQLKQSRESVSIDGYVTTSTLRFTPTREDHGSRLLCRAHNTDIPSSSIQDSWQLKVYYKPYVNLRLGNKLHHSQIYEGKDVYFECNVISNPPAEEIQWKFDDKDLKANVSSEVIISNHTVILKKIQRRNKGSYKCVAINSEGQGESNAIYLRVQYAPFCRPGQKIIYGAARHEAIQVVCEVDADPSEVTFRWKFNNTVDNLDIVNFRIEGTTSVATYSLHTQHDYGTLLCWGENEVGNQREPCVYTVVPAGPPDPVENCTIINQTEDTIAVQCSPGYNGGLQQVFILEIHDTVMHRLLVNMTSDTPLFSVKDLPSDTSLILVIYAVNNKGKSQPVVVKTYTQPNEQHEGKIDSWQLRFNPVTIALCSVVISLALIAVIIVVVVMCRHDYYLKVNSHKRRHENKEPQEDHQLNLCRNLADEKGPDVIADHKIKSGEEKLLDNSSIQTKFTTEIKLDEEDKDTYNFVHSSTNCTEYLHPTKSIKTPLSRMRQGIEKLQTEV